MVVKLKLQILSVLVRLKIQICDKQIFWFNIGIHTGLYPLYFTLRERGQGDVMIILIR